MSHLNYRRSADREREVKKKLESQGWYVIRSSGSHGAADLIAVRPVKCSGGEHYEVRFIQIKVSERAGSETNVIVQYKGAAFPINLEFWRFPVKSALWRAKRKQKQKNA